MKKLIAWIFFATHKRELSKIQQYFDREMESLNNKVPEYYHDEAKARIIAVSHVMRLLGAPGSK